MKKIHYLLGSVCMFPGLAMAVQLPTANEVLNNKQQSWDIQTLVMTAGLTIVGLVIAILCIKGLWQTISGALSKLDDVKYGKAELSDVVMYALSGLGLLVVTIAVGYWVYSMWGG